MKVFRSYLGGEAIDIIGRALHFGAKLLVLDEPTAFLSVRETRKVLEYVEEAKRTGLSVTFITHNIWHVYPVADRFTILERGVKVIDFNKEDVTPEHLAKIMSSGYVLARLVRSCG